jgi:FG-GAP-like repeat
MFCMKTTIGFLLMLTLAARAQTSAPSFKVQVVDNQIDIGYGLAIGDVDGDRKPDILLADQREIVWYRNGDWKRFVMAEKLTEKDNVCLAARDIDGDGKVEVAVGAQWNPAETNDTTQSGAVFYLIRPADPTQRWEAVRLPHEVTIHRMKWVQVAPRRFQLVVVPLHGRGNTNGNGRGARTWAYEPPRNPREAWPRQLVDSTMHLTHNLDVVASENAENITIAGKEGGKNLAYVQNKWQHLANSWVAPNYPMGELQHGRLAANQRFTATVEPMHGNQLVVYHTQNSRRKVLATNLNQGHALVCGDFLGKGSSQVVVGWRTPNADKKVGVRMWIPQDNAGENWQEYPLDDSVMMACEDLQAADLDGDGDLDLVASGRATLNVLIYWNQKQ